MIIWRVPVLGLGIYGIGYNQAIVEYAQNPELMEFKLLRQVMASWDVEKITDPKDKSCERNRRIQRVGKRIIKSAHKHVYEKVKEAEEKASNKYNAAIESDPSLDISKEEFMKRDEDFEFWTNASIRMGRISEWKCRLIHTEAPNAFVTSMLPRQIFVTSAFVDRYSVNDDELAFIMGHEISHLILDHNTDSFETSTGLKFLELFIIACDPFDGEVYEMIFLIYLSIHNFFIFFLFIFIGLASIALLSFASFLGSLVEAQESQENEFEADDLGLTLAAMSCFDTRNGTLIMKKMLHDSNESESDTLLLAQYLSSHPPTAKRYSRLFQASKDVNKGAFAHSTCREEIRKTWLQSISFSSLKG